METRRKFVARGLVLVAGKILKLNPLQVSSFVNGEVMAGTVIEQLERKTFNVVFDFENVFIFADPNNSSLDTSDVEELMRLENYSFEGAFEEALKINRQNLEYANTQLQQRISSYTQFRNSVPIAVVKEENTKFLVTAAEMYKGPDNSLTIREAQRIIVADDAELYQLQKAIYARAIANNAQQHREFRLNKDAIKREVFWESPSAKPTFFVDQKGKKFCLESSKKHEIKIKSQEKQNSWLETIAKSRNKPLTPAKKSVYSRFLSDDIASKHSGVGMH